MLTRNRVPATVFAGALLASLAAVVQGPALAEAPEPVCGGVSVGAAEVAVSDEARDRLGLTGWPDSGMGVERTADGQYRFHAPDAFGGNGQVNQRNVVTAGTLENPVAHGVTAAAPLQGVPAGYQWAGGGPIWRSPDGVVVKVLHFERYGPNMFYSELHLGRHDPATGVTTYLGPLVRPTIDFDTATAVGQIADVGMSSLTFVDGYLYVYFPDFFLDGSGRPQSTALSVARARAEDVARAARAGTVTPWHKYHNGGWQSPAVGGASSDLQPGQNMLWAPHAVRAAGGGVVVVAPVNEREVVMTTSRDGISGWSPRVPLFRDPDRYNAYVTVIGTGPDPSVVGDDFYVYNTQFMDTDPHWSNVQLVRHRVTCTAATTPGTTALIRYLDGTGRHRVTVGAVHEPGLYPQFGGIWGLLTAEQPGTRALYECRRGARDYYVSRDRGCDGRGDALLRTLGWIYEARPVHDSTPLYRCALPSIGDHYVSILADCETPHAVQEGLLGYALATSRTPLSRFYDGKDHWDSTDSVSASYAMASLGSYVENSPRPGTIPLYGCSYAVPGGVNHFISVTSNCEGLTMVRLEGHIHLAPPSADYRPLYRCFRPPANDHFVSTDENCDGLPGAAREGRLGYVPLTPGFARP